MILILVSTCSVSGLPPEYIEFAGKDVDIDACKAWLKSTHPDMYDELYGEVEDNEDGDGTAAADSKKKKKKKVGFQSDAEKKIRVIK